MWINENIWFFQLMFVNTYKIFHSELKLQVWKILCKFSKDNFKGTASRDLFTPVFSPNSSSWSHWRRLRTVSSFANFLRRFSNYYCTCALNVAWGCKINPAKSLNGASSRILNGPGTKSRLFWPLKWSWATARGDFGAKKVKNPSKSQDFLQGTILNPWNGPIQWFRGLNS